MGISYSVGSWLRSDFYGFDSGCGCVLVVERNKIYYFIIVFILFYCNIILFYCVESQNKTTDVGLFVK